jgi:hypothetical protein
MMFDVSSSDAEKKFEGRNSFNYFLGGEKKWREKDYFLTIIQKNPFECNRVLDNPPNPLMAILSREPWIQQKLR